MPATFAAVFAALYAAHSLADHWVQTDYQARTKSLPGWQGHLSCTVHVATYTATAAAFLLLLVWRTGLNLNPTQVAAGLAVSAVTHYVADRRTPLIRMANWTGSGDFAQVKGGGINGAYLLDQSWHITWLFVAALVMA